MLAKVPRSTLITVGAIAAVALAVRVYGIGWGLPAVNEEAYPLKVAWGLWGWGPQHGFHLNPHFFKYPSLIIYLQFLGQGLLFLILSVAGAVHSALDFRVLYMLDPTSFYVLGRLITALFGAATVVPTYLLGERVSGRAAGAMAALLVALNVPLVSKSQVVEVDVPLACLVTFSLLLALSLLERPTQRKALVAGLMVGLATSVKYPGLFAVVPAVVALALSPRTRPAAVLARASTRRDRRRQARRADRTARPAGESRLWMLAWLALGVVVGLLATSPFLLLDARSFWSQLAQERQHMRLGHFGTAAGWSWGFYALAWFKSLVGWPLGIASLAGMVFFAWRRSRWSWVLGALVVVSFTAMGSWTMKADRYLLPLVPLGAVFAAAMVSWLAGSPPWRGSRPARAGIWVGAFALMLWPQLAWAPAHLEQSAPEASDLAKRWIEANVPAGSFVLSEFYGPELLCPDDFTAMDGELAAAVCRHSRRPVYALQLLPMFQVAPERSADFYDLRFLEMADEVVVTSSVRERYRADPNRFPRQVALYDTLEHRFTKLHEFRDRSGNAVTIYRNPRQGTRFSARTAPGVVPTLSQRTAALGGESAYYRGLGTNLEAFGFVEDALRAYEEGMRFGFADRASMMEITRAIVRCQLRLQRRDAALAFLSREEAQPRPARELARLRDWRREVETGTFAMQALSCASP